MATATAYISGTVYCDTYPIQYADVILTRYVEGVTSTIPQYHQITDKNGSFYITFPKEKLPREMEVYGVQVSRDGCFSKQVPSLLNIGDFISTGNTITIESNNRVATYESLYALGCLALGNSTSTQCLTYEKVATATATLITTTTEGGTSEYTGDVPTDIRIAGSHSQKEALLLSEILSRSGSTVNTPPTISISTGTTTPTVTVTIKGSINRINAAAGIYNIQLRATCSQTLTGSLELTVQGDYYIENTVCAWEVPMTVGSTQGVATSANFTSTSTPSNLSIDNVIIVTNSTGYNINLKY